MLILADRGYYAFDLWQQFMVSGAVWGSRTRAGSLTSGNRRVGMILTCRCGSCT
jgi:hypothetical protein